jgi:hypothetical protein
VALPRLEIAEAGRVGPASASDSRQRLLADQGPGVLVRAPDSLAHLVPYGHRPRRGLNTLLRLPSHLPDEAGCEPLVLEPAAAPAASLLASAAAETRLSPEGAGDYRGGVNL